MFLAILKKEKSMIHSLLLVGKNQDTSLILHIAGVMRLDIPEHHRKMCSENTKSMLPDIDLEVDIGITVEIHFMNIGKISTETPIQNEIMDHLIEKIFILASVAVNLMFLCFATKL